MSDRKKLTVLGGGESGVGAALLAAQIGIPVWLSDAGAMADRYRATLRTLAMRSRIYIVGGTHPTLRDGLAYTTLAEMATASSSSE